MKIKKRFAILNIIMLAVPIMLIGAVSFVCLILFVVKFPVEEIAITRAQILNPANFTHALAEFFENNPSAVGYLAAWVCVSLAILSVSVTAVTQLLSRSVHRPISELAEAAEKISAGNLDFDVLGSDYDEINSLCESFDNMRLSLRAAERRAREMNDEKNMLLANLSHDLKTPLTSIKGYIEGIRDGVADTPEKLNRYLDTIYAKAAVIDGLVSNLSEYSRLERSGLSLELREADLNTFLRELLEEYRLDLERNGMSLTFRPCAEPTPVRIDMDKLARVFANIINNSIKYKKGESGSITVTTSVDNGVYVEFSDTGIGIAPEDRDRVFDAFCRADSSRSISGSGLGLSIARQITERHGGRIWIAGRGGEGITTIMYLPMKRGQGYE